MQAAINEYSAFAASTDPAYDHISAEDRDKVASEVRQAADWLAAKTSEQVP